MNRKGQPEIPLPYSNDGSYGDYGQHKPTELSSAQPRCLSHRFLSLSFLHLSIIFVSTVLVVCVARCCLLATSTFRKAQTSQGSTLLRWWRRDPGRNFHACFIHCLLAVRCRCFANANEQTHKYRLSVRAATTPLSPQLPGCFISFRNRGKGDCRGWLAEPHSGSDETAICHLQRIKVLNGSRAA